MVDAGLSSRGWIPMTPNHYQNDPYLQGSTRAALPLLPRFAWAEARRLPLAIRHVQRLTGASASTARLIAELAGLSTGEEGGDE